MDVVKALPYFLLTVAFGVGAQFLMKKGVADLAGQQANMSMAAFLKEHLFELLLSWAVILAIVCNGVTAVSYMYILRQFPPSRALPVLGGLTYITLFIVDKLFMKEQTSMQNFLGIMLITGGLYFVSVK